LLATARILIGATYAASDTATQDPNRHDPEFSDPVRVDFLEHSRLNYERPEHD
jgi:hypothetical protein